jgi:hypothetical protein
LGEMIFTPKFSLHWNYLQNTTGFNSSVASAYRVSC